MKLTEALQKAKQNGYKKTVCHPYSYWPRSIDSYIKENESFVNSPDYKGSSASFITWKYDEKDQSINGDDGTWFALIK